MELIGPLLRTAHKRRAQFCSWAVPDALDRSCGTPQHLMLHRGFWVCLRHGKEAAFVATPPCQDRLIHGLGSRRW